MKPSFRFYETEQPDDANPVGIYFKQLDKLPIKEWEIIKAKYVNYKKARDSFNGYFMKSKLVKIITETNPNGIRYLKPPKQGSCHYEFPYTYLAVYDSMTIAKEGIAYIESTLQNAHGFVDKLKIKRQENALFKSKYGMSAGQFMKDASKLISLYDIMIKARDSVVRNNLSLVVNIANNFKHNPSPSMDFSDLIQEGNLGLLKTIESFDVDANIKFSSYGVIGIMNQIKRSLTSKSWIIRLPDRVIKNGYIITKERRKFIREFGRTPTNQEIAERTDIPTHEVKDVTRILNKFTSLTSLDQIVLGNRDEGEDGDIDIINSAASYSNIDKHSDTNISDSVFMFESLVEKIMNDMNMSGDKREIIMNELGLHDGLKYTKEQSMEALEMNETTYNQNLETIQSMIKQYKQEVSDVQENRQMA